MAAPTIASKLLCRTLSCAYDAAMGRFPAVVRLETTNACNAKCIICPHRDMQRPVATMDDALYRRLIDQCAEAHCREVHLHNFGEPMMDRRIEDRIAYAKQKGIRRVKIFCNGSLLGAERGKRLIEVGLDEIKVSLDGATSEEFERIRTPLKFDAVVQNVIELVKLRNAARSKMRIRVACCSTTDKQSTMKMLEKTVDDFSFGKLHNWGGQDVIAKRTRKPCSRLWRTFTVLANGDVSLCCLDYDGQHILGHMDSQRTIGDVWRDRPYQDVRRAHREANQSAIPLCANCTKAFL